MRFALPIACVLTFCIVCIGNSDAIVPFGYILAEFSKEDSIPLAIRILLFVPLAGTLLSSFVWHSLARSILTCVNVLALVGLWTLGLIIYVVNPMPDNQIPNSVPAVTSIPFVLVVLATITHSIRIMMRRARQQPIGIEKARMKDEG